MLKNAKYDPITQQGFPKLEAFVDRKTTWQRLSSSYQQQMVLSLFPAIEPSSLTNKIIDGKRGEGGNARFSPEENAHLSYFTLKCARLQNHNMGVGGRHAPLSRSLLVFF